MREKRTRNSLSKQNPHHARGCKQFVCVLACLFWVGYQFVQIVNKWVYNIISKRNRVYRPNLMVLMSVRTMTKLDCWLPTIAVQRLISLEENSFEIELEQEQLWRTTMFCFPGASLGTMHDGQMEEVGHSYQTHMNTHVLCHTCRPIAKARDSLTA